MTDVMGGLKKSGYEPKENINEFKPVKGSYVCRIDTAGLVEGVSKNTGDPYRFRTIKMQVSEIIGGDNATNRYFDMAYNPDEKGVTRLLNDLFTAGIDTTGLNSDADLDEFLGTLKDKTMCISAWAAKKMRKEGDQWVAVDPPEMVQKLKVVKEFKGKKNPGAAASSTPF